MTNTQKKTRMNQDDVIKDYILKRIKAYCLEREDCMDCDFNNSEIECPFGTNVGIRPDHFPEISFSLGDIVKDKNDIESRKYLVYKVSDPWVSIVDIDGNAFEVVKGDLKYVDSVQDIIFALQRD